jgi:hypothetical protein
MRSLLPLALLSLVVLVLSPSPALAQGATPLGDLSRYRIDRDKGDLPVDAGRRFMADLKTHDAEVWSNVRESVRLELQKGETESFVEQLGWVMWAYGGVWVILLLFALAVFWRQHRLSRELAELEARVKVEKA